MVKSSIGKLNKINRRRTQWFAKSTTLQFTSQTTEPTLNTQITEEIVDIKVIEKFTPPSSTRVQQ